MITVNAKKDPQWLSKSLEALRIDGCAIVQGVLDQDFLKVTEERMVAVQRQIWETLGEERLARAGELGVLRIMASFDPFFLKYLEVPELLEVVDGTVSPTAILQVQQGSILPSFPKGQAPPVFQNIFHADFPRYLNGYVAAVNIFFAVSRFTKENGATLLVPGTHQKAERPSNEFLESHAVSVECEAGSMFLFDSTLYHAAGENHSGQPRFGINHEFIRSYMKQQIDYVRALGDEIVLAQKPRTQQLLGWYARVVTSLDEYYRPEHERLYRKGQG
jgi:ectoine hydroxylase-related dioxygenase (phytanoyl-CoA dioxygenase family)